MTNQLSRAETYGHRKKRETKQRSKKDHHQPNKQARSDNKAQSTKHNSSKKAASAPATLSRVQKKQQPNTKKSSQQIQEAETLPTRSDLFPSQRVRLSKWFVNSLIIIFILLTGALVYWGIIGAPPLRTLL
ncbi:hypothetical protein [Paenibacillus sp. TCA20]|uniref:hypothetical protein n=1 Tax=Paenibacillus sp. TCA20 TaxID=1499968 RepID=UPI00064C4AE9|nr:hypothetical protein [Paenibacillus sp. TCA20]